MSGIGASMAPILFYARTFHGGQKTAAILLFFLAKT
jgi:hypothetical protein